MAIKLWQRKQGLITPPEQPIHAEPGSRAFPLSFRTRLIRWTVLAIGRRFPSDPYTSFGDDSREQADQALNSLCQQLADAYGRSFLVPLNEMKRAVRSSADMGAHGQIPVHLEQCTDHEVLDLIDGVFQVLVQTSDGYAATDRAVLEHAEIDLNSILEEEGIGYRYTEGELIRFDDAVTHGEAVQPAMELLAGGHFGHANGEFRRALECYRSGNWRDAITNANASFESVLKVVTDKPQLTAGALITEAKRQGVIPGSMQSAAENLGKLMNVVPAVRGQEGAHGLGKREQNDDELKHLASLIVPVAAAFIVYIGRNR